MINNKIVNTVEALLFGAGRPLRLSEIKSLYPLSQEVVKGLRQLKNKTFSQSDHYIGRNLSCLIKLSWTEQEVQARALNMANCIKIHCI